MSADNEDSLDFQFARIAKVLEASLKEDALSTVRDSATAPVRTMTESPKRSAVALVKEWMTTPGNEDWLLILDNFDDVKINIGRFLPIGATGSVLITTRDRRVIGPLANAGVELREMDLANAEQLLSRLCFTAQTQIPKDPEGHPDHSVIQRIVEELHGFPLALSQAAAFVRENAPMTFQEYLDYLVPRTEDRELLLRFKEANPKYPESIMTTWEISFRHLEKSNSQASTILQLLGFLGASNIPEPLLRSATIPLQWEFAPVAFDSQPVSYPGIDISFLANNVNFRVAVGVLISFSLIGRTLGDLWGPYLNVHPLVHEWIRVRLNPQPAIQAKFTIMAAVVLFQYFPLNHLVKISKRTTEGNSISADFRSRTILIFLHLDSVVLNLKEYSKNSPEIPPECSALLAAAFLAYKYELPDEMRTLGTERLDGLCAALQTIATCHSSHYHHLHAVLASITICLHRQESIESRLQAMRSIIHHLSASEMTKSLSNTRSGVLVVLIACVVQLIRSWNVLNQQFQSAGIRQTGGHGAEIALVLARLRNTIDWRPSESAFDQKLKIYLEYHFAQVLSPSDYWQSTDHFLTDVFSTDALLDLEPEVKHGYISACARLHWERTPVKDFTGTALTYSLALSVVTNALGESQNNQMMSLAKLEAGIRQWSRSSYISSAGGRFSVFARDAEGPSAIESTKTPWSDVAFWERSLSYVWKTCLSVAESFSMPGVTWLVDTGMSKEAKTLSRGQRRTSALTFLRRINDCIQHSNPDSRIKLDFLTLSEVQFTLIRVYLHLEDFSQALEILESLLGLSRLHDRYGAQRPLSWAVGGEPSYVTKDQFISYLEQSSIPTSRNDAVSAVLLLLYPSMSKSDESARTLSVKLSPADNERSRRKSKLETHVVEEASRWWNEIEGSTQRLAVKFLLQYRHDKQLNQVATDQPAAAKYAKFERLARELGEKMGPTRNEWAQEENLASRVFFQFGIVDTEVEKVLESHTDALIDQTITCLAALSSRPLPLQAAALMRAKLEVVVTSRLELARRLGKLSLLCDIACLEYFRNKWQKNSGRNVDSFLAMIDSHNALEAKLKEAEVDESVDGGEKALNVVAGTLHVVAETSDSEEETFFDFDE